MTPSSDDQGPPQDEYLRQVMAEIDEEVRRRRRELPARVERELDELFFEHSPVGNRRGALGDALRTVDASVFIDPVVPVESQKSGGALVKKGLRSLNLWYVGFVTHQVSLFAAAVSRALHLVDQQLEDLRRRVPPVTATPVVAAGDEGAWWTTPAVEALAAARGRVLHAACGDGWLVRALKAKGVDAYGVDPRPDVIERAELEGADLREDRATDHLRAAAPSSLEGVVLSGVVDGMAAGERDELLGLLADRLAPDAVLVVHSVSPSAWAAADAPPEVDLAPGRPLRPATWAHLLAGWQVDTMPGADGADYLVVARR